MDAFALYLRSQACNNAWANHRLLSACARLAPGEFEAPRTGFFPSIRETLNHNLSVDHHYLDALERSRAGQPLNEAARGFFDPARALATSAALQSAQAAADRRLIALCDGLDVAALASIVDVPRGIGPRREPLPRLLAHLFQHQIHHRGQAHAMLSGTSVEPPQLDDFFLASDAALRAQDFAVLGLTEAAVWPDGR